MDTRGTTRNAKASALSWIGRPSSERPLQMLRMCSSRRRPLRTSYSIDGLSSCERLRAVVSLPSTSSLIGNFMVEGGADITAAAAAAAGRGLADSIERVHAREADQRGWGALSISLGLAKRDRGISRRMCVEL